MRTRKAFQAVKPYLTAVAVIGVVSMLVFAIYFTELSMQWITFLTGILIASILAMATRASRAEWVVTRRTAQLSTAKDKLERETQLRKTAEKTVAADKPLLNLINDSLSVMVARVDADLHYRYHNRAYQHWLHLRPKQIDGRHMREVLGAKTYVEISPAVKQSLEGQVTRYNLTQQMSNGTTCLMSMEFVPQFGEDGKVSGFYILATDVTDLVPAWATSPAESADAAEHGGKHPALVATSAAQNETSEQNMYINSFTEQVIGQRDGNSRIMAAIEKNGFHLFCQRIIPLATSPGEAEHYEILIRLMEEEDNLMPPGAFFPLAEKHGLMPHLDRWVVQHIAEWLSIQRLAGKPHKGSIFFINTARDTINDPEFPKFVKDQLLKYDVPGSSLCFEIASTDAAWWENADVAEFARLIKQSGCHIALSGFGRDGVYFDSLRSLHADFLKIDGNIILNILRDPVELAKVSAINQVAKTMNVITIAEFVESEDIIAALRKIGVDAAQGFGISLPQPLAEIE